VSAHQNTAKPSLSYADAVKNPAPVARALSEKFVPSRLLKEVTVRRSSDAAPLQPSPQVVEAVNKARAGKPGKVIAARSLNSGDVLRQLTTLLPRLSWRKTRHGRLPSLAVNGFMAIDS
jgi:hypothetical protein